jgi:uncharacterized protein YhfF
MAKKYGRTADEIRLDIAYALSEGDDPLDYLRRQHAARWGGDDGD